MTVNEAINILELHNPFLGSDKNLTEAFDMAIKVLTAQRWIPCSKRLPKTSEHKDDMVLVCYGNGSIRFNTYRNGWVQGNPIAWMPLPDQWEGEEDG